MVRVVSHVPDGHVLGESAICSKNLVHSGPYLSSAPMRPSRAPVLQPLLAPWEEVQTHIHHTSRRAFVRNGLHPQCAFQIHQVGIEISVHQEIIPVGLIPDGRNGIIYD